MILDIYHGDQKITLLDSLPLINTFSQPFSVYQLESLEDFSLFSILANDTARHIVFYYINLELLLAQVKKEFKVIRAGGGLVLNAQNEVLLIKRLGKWDLPKGKLEKNELIEECALREVEEETGIDKVQLIDFCCHTYHTYVQQKQWVLKETSWFFMQTNMAQKLVPQTEELIEQAIWVPMANLDAYYADAFENISFVLKQATLK